MTEKIEYLPKRIKQLFDALRTQVEVTKTTVENRLTKRIDDFAVNLVDSLKNENNTIVNHVKNFDVENFKNEIECLKEKISNEKNSFNKINMVDELYKKLQAKKQEILNKVEQVKNLNQLQVEFKSSDFKFEQDFDYFKLINNNISTKNNQLKRKFDDIENKTKISKKLKLETTIFNGHRSIIRCIVMLKNGMIVTGTCDNLINIWASDNYRFIRNIPGHTKQINCFSVLENGNLVSGSADGTIKIWDTNTFECICTLSHCGAVSCLEYFSPRFFVSGSFDMTVKFWDQTTFELKHTINQSESPIKCLALNKYTKPGSSLEIDNNINRRLICGHENGDIIVCYVNIDVHDVFDTQNSLKLNQHGGPVNSLALLQRNELISCSNDCTIKVLNKFFLDCNVTLDDHKTVVDKILILPNDKFISISYGNCLKVWESSSFKNIKTENASKIFFIELLENGKIVLALSDFTLKFHS